MKKSVLLIVPSVIAIMLVAACTPQQALPEVAPEPEPIVEPEAVAAPEPEIVEEPEEELEIEKEEPAVVSKELAELLSLADQRVQNLNYRYKGPGTSERFWEFWVKGDKIKYIRVPSFRDVNLDKDAYDTIYLDTTTQTAQAYCTGQTCRQKGKKADLTYDDAYVWTPFDWINNIEEGTVHGEELIDKRKAKRVETRALGTIYIDAFYGLPLQIQSGDDVYQIVELNLNNVKDEDVTP